MTLKIRFVSIRNVPVLFTVRIRGTERERDGRICIGGRCKTRQPPSHRLLTRIGAPFPRSSDPTPPPFGIDDNSLRGSNWKASPSKPRTARGPEISGPRIGSPLAHIYKAIRSPIQTPLTNAPPTTYVHSTYRERDYYATSLYQRILKAHFSESKNRGEGGAAV